MLQHLSRSTTAQIKFYLAVQAAGTPLQVWVCELQNALWCTAGRHDSAVAGVAAKCDRCDPICWLNFSVYETLKDMTLKAYGESFLLHIIHQQSYCALSAHDMANASSYHTCAPPVSRSKACAVDLHI